MSTVAPGTGGTTSVNANGQRSLNPPGSTTPTSTRVFPDNAPTAELSASVARPSGASGIAEALANLKREPADGSDASRIVEAIKQAAEGSGVTVIEPTVDLPGLMKSVGRIAPREVNRGLAGLLAGLREIR